jgi:hypothetical protein
MNLIYLFLIEFLTFKGFEISCIVTCSLSSFKKTRTFSVLHNFWIINVSMIFIRSVIFHSLLYMNQHKFENKSLILITGSHLWLRSLEACFRYYQVFTKYCNLLHKQTWVDTRTTKMSLSGSSPQYLIQLQMIYKMRQTQLVKCDCV